MSKSVVRKIGGRKQVVSAKPPLAKTRAAGEKRRLAAMSLPTERKVPQESLLAYTGLIYGREKIGKTTLLSSFPRALFLATEPGTKGASIYEFNTAGGGVRDWSTFLRAVDLLEAVGQGSGGFDTVVVDTADRAYEMCLDSVCAGLGIPYPGQDAGGKEDYGRSWKAVRQEFLRTIHRLEFAGFGVWFTSHATEREISTRSGDRYTRIFPSMTGQARSVIEALVDFFFYAEYFRDQTSRAVRRVLVCQGDETIWAGGRKTPHGEFPRFLPLLQEAGFDVIQDAFAGKDVGLDPATLRGARLTTTTAKEFVDKQKARGSLARIAPDGEAARRVKGQAKTKVRRIRKK